MNKTQVLIIEDDPAVSNLIAMTLETQEYQYHIAMSGLQGYLDIVNQHPNVILLDLGLPDMDGVMIIKKVREWTDIPIIVISARIEDHDKVEALDAGADDYLIKPFSVEELLARLRVVLRRGSYMDRGEESNIYVNGEIKIDYTAGCVYRGGKEIHLTPIEYKLLCLLAQNTGKVLTHNFIIEQIWGNALPTDTPSLRVFMATLRKKIEYVPSKPHYLQTRIGIGYRMLRVVDGQETNNR